MKDHHTPLLFALLCFACIVVAKLFPRFSPSFSFSLASLLRQRRLHHHHHRCYCLQQKLEHGVVVCSRKSLQELRKGGTKVCLSS